MPWASHKSGADLIFSLWIYRRVNLYCLNITAVLHLQMFQALKAGGSLINNKWILTASHIFGGDRREGRWHEKYYVVLGKILVLEAFSI